MSVTVNIGNLDVQVTAERLTQEAFAPYGDVIANPRPDLHPAAFASEGGSLPYSAASANQGTAIRYAHISKPRDLYAQSPSGEGQLIMSQFICAGQKLPTVNNHGEFIVSVLERHPFTTQTFAPLESTASAYLVIVAPSLQPGSLDEDLPAPQGGGLPGRGLPDVRGLRAFVATRRQAVTYGAGTWHAPMAAVGDQGTTLDFLVVQYASGVGVEDCQYALFESDGLKEPRVKVRVPVIKERLERL